METKGEAKGPVGLILVHGIGEQRPGDTLEKLLRAIRLRFPGVAVDMQAGEEAAAVLRAPLREVRVYESYWAPLLSGEFVADSFRIDALFEVGWFPSLNRRRLVYRDGQYRGWVVRGWTLALVPLILLLHLALLGVRAFLKLGEAVRNSLVNRDTQRKRRERDKALREEAGGGLRGFWTLAQERAREGREEPAAMKLALDRVVADVTNYVDAAAGAFPEGVPEDRREAARRIEDVLRNTIRRAVEEDGCEEIQILAHSLGTLVTFRVLSMDGAACEAAHVSGDSNPGPGSPRQPVPLTALYTIGSPLEKIRFIWPSILKDRPGCPAVLGPHGALAVGAPTFRWENFSSPLDLVSGRLVRFDLWGSVHNHPAPEVGGLARAHVSYEVSPVFLERLGATLLGVAPAGNSEWMRRWGSAALGFFETLAVPTAFLLLAALGGAALWFTGWLFADGLLRIPQGFGLMSEEARHTGAVITGVVFAAIGAFGGLPASRRRADELHAAYFSRGEDRPPAD